MLRVATIGAGWVSTNRHLPSLRRHPGVRLVGVIDRHQERAAAAARRFGIQHATSLDAEWTSAVDAVVIGTPPPSHHDLVIEALARGLHVLVEKPFAMNPVEGRAMIAAAERSGRVLAVVHNFQFARSVSAARRRFETGAAGELRAVLGLQLSSHDRRLPAWYKGLPCGLFYDEAPHLLYLLRAFAGDLDLRNCYVSPGPALDDRTPRLVSAISEGRVIASIEMLFDTSISEWQLVLTGSRETLVADIFRDILVRLPNDGSHSAAAILRTSFMGVAGHLRGTLTSGIRHVVGSLDYGNDEVVRRFVEAVRTGEPPRDISARDGLAVVEAMASVLSAAPPACLGVAADR